MKGLVLIKIGGSSITDVTKESVAKRDVIKRLAQEIHKANGKVNIILGHGQGSFGHITASKYQTQKGLINDKSQEGAALTQNVARQLHNIVIEELCSAGVNALSFPPAAGSVSKNRRLIDWNIAPIKLALERGFVPITGGDVMIDTELGVTIVPTEEPLRYIAGKLKPNKVILGGDIDGVFTANPKIVKDARLIKEINGTNIEEALRGASGSTKVDVTGGMKNKLEYAYEIAKSCNTVCHIVNIDVPGRLYSAIIDEEVVGTKINA